MTVREVVGTVVQPDGTPAPYATVEIDLIASLTGKAIGWVVTDGVGVAGRTVAKVDNTGSWSVDLQPNILIDPANTVYRVKYVDRGWTDTFEISVPDTVGPHNVIDILSVTPEDLPTNALNNEIAARIAGDAEVQANLDAHLADTVDAHDATAISFAPTGGIVATDVQAAIAELASDAATAYQPVDSDLTAIAALATTSFGRGLLTLLDAAALRTTAGTVIGTDVQAYSAVLQATTASFTTADETKLDGIETGATADQTAAEILAALLTVDGAGSGLDADLLDGLSSAAFQPVDSDLTAIAALTTTPFGRGLLALADAAALRTSAGLGTIATQNASSVAITGGTITGITDLAIADGGTGASDAATARTNLVAERKQTFNVRDYGAVCDGVTNDTAAVQACFDAAIAAAPATIIGSGTCSVTELTLTNASNITVDGRNWKLLLRATGARIFGIKLAGTCDNVEIRNLTITGNAVVADAHAGIGCVNGQTLTNIRVLNNTIRSTTLGVSFSADTSGTITGLTISQNKIDSIVGTTSGNGYGLHFAGMGTTPHRVKFIGNEINAVQRHSIYQAMGVGTVIANNIITNHRNTSNDGSVLSAITIARSRSVTCYGNQLLHCYGGGVYVGGPVGSSFSDGIVVEGNVFTDPQDATASVYVGQQAPATEGFPTGVSVLGNVFNTTGGNRLGLQVYNGKHLRIAGNHFLSVGNTSTVTAIRFSGTGETTNAYTDNIVVEDNFFHMETSSGTAAAVRLSGAETITAAMRFSNNVISGATVPFAVTVGVTNPNLKVQHQSITGLSYSGTAPSDGWYRNTNGTFFPNRVILAGSSQIINGAGSPEGATTAPVGSTYVRADGSAGATLYVKETGAGNTGWIPYGPSAAAPIVTALPTAAVGLRGQTRILEATGQPDRVYVCTRLGNGTSYDWVEVTG